MANLGRASTLVASDATTTAIGRIERAAIAAATPITYPGRYLVFFFLTKTNHSGFCIHLQLFPQCQPPFRFLF